MTSVLSNLDVNVSKRSIKRLAPDILDDQLRITDCGSDSRKIDKTLEISSLGSYAGMRPKAHGKASLDVCGRATSTHRLPILHNPQGTTWYTCEATEVEPGGQVTGDDDCNTVWTGLTASEVLKDLQGALRRKGFGGTAWANDAGPGRKGVGAYNTGADFYGFTNPKVQTKLAALLKNTEGGYLGITNSTSTNPVHGTINPLQSLDHSGNFTHEHYANPSTLYAKLTCWHPRIPCQKLLEKGAPSAGTLAKQAECNTTQFCDAEAYRSSIVVPAEEADKENTAPAQKDVGSPRAESQGSVEAEVKPDSKGSPVEAACSAQEWVDSAWEGMHDTYEVAMEDCLPRTVSQGTNTIVIDNEGVPVHQRRSVLSLHLKDSRPPSPGIRSPTPGMEGVVTARMGGPTADSQENGESPAHAAGVSTPNVPLGGLESALSRLDTLAGLDSGSSENDPNLRLLTSPAMAALKSALPSEDGSSNPQSRCSSAGTVNSISSSECHPGWIRPTSDSEPAKSRSPSAEQQVHPGWIRPEDAFQSEDHAEESHPGWIKPSEAVIIEGQNQPSPGLEKRQHNPDTPVWRTPTAHADPRSPAPRQHIPREQVWRTPTMHVDPRSPAPRQHTAAEPLWRTPTMHIDPRSPAPRQHNPAEPLWRTPAMHVDPRSPAPAAYRPAGLVVRTPMEHLDPRSPGTLLDQISQ
eukprot:gene12519-2284_t